MGNFTEVAFPGLGWTFNVPSEAFSIGDYSVKWYGIIIAFGFALAVFYGGRMAYKWKMSIDGMLDVLIWGTCLGIVGARIYYVVFQWDMYKDNLLDIFKIWEGGIAIYGGIIGALIGAFIACKLSKVDFRNLLDLGALGLLIGQGIGRWGNFMNQEAFGTNTTTALFRMTSPKITNTLLNEQAALLEKGISVDPFAPVHPTFLYESLWCLLGFIILHLICKKARKFKGEVFMLYGVWYGIERMVVEGLRTDSLYISGTTIRVSQALSAAIVLVALIALIIDFARLKKGTLPKSARLDVPIPTPVTESHGGAAKDDLSDVTFEEMSELTKCPEIQPKGFDSEENSTECSEMSEMSALSEIEGEEAQPMAEMDFDESGENTNGKNN